MIKNFDKRSVPMYLIILALIIFFPLGMYFLVWRWESNLQNIKRKAMYLNFIGVIILGIVLVYFFINLHVYVNLFDSHMSLDMYSYNFIYTYIYLLIVIASLFIGGKFLNDLCQKYVIYTEFINIRHIKDIKLIQDETLEDIEEIKKNIRLLIERGCLINVRLDDDHLVSTKTVNNDEMLVACRTCGNVCSLNKKQVHCDFCDRSLNVEDSL